MAFYLYIANLIRSWYFNIFVGAYVVKVIEKYSAPLSFKGWSVVFGVLHSVEYFISAFQKNRLTSSSK
jgi:uncharacterized membrane protein